MNALSHHVLVGAVSIAAFASLSQAAAITVPGGDFENVTAGPSSSTVGQLNNSSPNWVGVAGPNGGLVGTLEVLGETIGGSANPNFNSGFYSSADLSANGHYIGFTQGAGTTYSNTLTNTYAANSVYTLAALVGNSYESPGGNYTFNLADDLGTVYATTTGAFPAGNTTVPVSFSFDTGTNPLAVGHTIKIEYVAGANGTQSFDNVTLNVVPEPASLSLLALGGMTLIGRRRKA